jgi:hypothetical protein
MSSRMIVATVILLVVLVGAIFLFIANKQGGDSDTRSLETVTALR